MADETTNKTFRLCLELRTVRVPGIFNSNSEYHLTYDSLEHISDQFSEGPQLTTQLCNCVIVGA